LPAGLKHDDAGGLVSKRRGRLAITVCLRRIVMWRCRWCANDTQIWSAPPSPGQALATEKLAEVHGRTISHETLRGWMIAAGLWIDRRHGLPPRINHAAGAIALAPDHCDETGIWTPTGGERADMGYATSFNAGSISTISTDLTSSVSPE
jgi:hypothetical protein